MTRVVIDTNIYISALVFGGTPQRVFDVIQSDGLVLYLSDFIKDEVTGTLSKKFNWTRHEVQTFLPPLWKRCVLVKPTVRLRVCSDPDDDHVLECAVAAGADYLVTGNTKHFPLSYGSTKVITARQFLTLFRPA